MQQKGKKLDLNELAKSIVEQATTKHEENKVPSKKNDSKKPPGKKS